MDKCCLPCSCRERMVAAARCLRASRGTFAEAVAHRRLSRWRMRWHATVSLDSESVSEHAQWVKDDTAHVRRALGVTWLDLLAGWLRRWVR